MQSKLATWSTEDRERKFDRLLRLIADRDWLSEAARITLASSGARTPGVDGVDKRMLEAKLQHELATIRNELLAGVKPRATLSRLGVETASNSFHLGV